MIEQPSPFYGEIDLARVGGLLFDVDGTLSDTDDRWVERITRGLRPIRWMWKHKDPRQFARWFVMSAETPANFLYSVADRLHLDGFFSKGYDWLSRKWYRKATAHERFWLVADVREMLEYFHGKLPMGIVSARDKKTTLNFLNHFDLLPFFEVIVTAQTCQFTKPFPDPVLFGAEKLGITADQCLMIGDTVVDIRAGKSAGAQTVGVLCGFGTQSELERAGAELIVAETADLMGYFQERQVMTSVKSKTAN